LHTTLSFMLANITHWISWLLNYSKYAANTLRIWPVFR
jgi:hypothetical protein